MTRKDHLLYMLKTNQFVIKKLLDDITEEESMIRGEGGFNHIRWLTGHLYGSDGYSFSLLGVEDEATGKYSKIFGGGSVVSDDPAVYPSMADIRDRLYKSHDKLMEVIEAAPDGDLEKEIGGERKQPVWQGLTFLAMHEFYHAGQIVHIRKMLGRSRPFA
ncbi:conserved hypothetical protein [Candidatus Zixiibacteriota bacterium]|nr:conserved hypothetical protein [candidate division Zixibacteria bacterium]